METIGIDNLKLLLTSLDKIKISPDLQRFFDWMEAEYQREDDYGLTIANADWQFNVIKKNGEWHFCETSIYQDFREDVIEKGIKFLNVLFKFINSNDKRGFVE